MGDIFHFHVFPKVVFQQAFQGFSIEDNPKLGASKHFVLQLEIQLSQFPQ